MRLAVHSELENMGKISVVLSEKAEFCLRKVAFDLYQGKKGSISTIVEEALREWCASHGYEHLI